MSWSTPLLPFPHKTITTQLPKKDTSYGKNAPGFPFGPTVRVKGGESANMLIANNLVDAAPESVDQENNYRDPTYTNMHTCVIFLVVF